MGTRYPDGSTPCHCLTHECSLCPAQMGSIPPHEWRLDAHLLINAASRLCSCAVRVGSCESFMSGCSCACAGRPWLRGCVELVRLAFRGTRLRPRPLLLGSSSGHREDAQQPPCLRLPCSAHHESTCQLWRSLPTRSTGRPSVQAEPVWGHTNVVRGRWHSLPQPGKPMWLLTGAGRPCRQHCLILLT